MTEQLIALFVRGLRHRFSLPAACLLIALGIVFAGGRAYLRYSVPSNQFDFARSGMSDFHNGAYFPAQAFQRGINPYSLDVCEHFPMARSAPPYSPVVFMLYLPFAWLPLPLADFAFFIFNLGLLAWLAWFIVSIVRQEVGRHGKQPAQAVASGLLARVDRDGVVVAWLFGLLLFSRPGHITLFTGYFTLQLVIGTLLALHYANRRPWLAAFGLLLASGKPTYILPLMILMAARRNFRALAFGFGLCALVAGAGLGWLALHADVNSVVTGIVEGQEAFDNDPTEDPVNTWTRLDLMGVIAKLLQLKPSGLAYLSGMLAMLAPICWILWNQSKAERNSGATGLTASIASLAILITIYHHSYDGLLAATVWVSVLLGGRATLPTVAKWKFPWLAAALTVPAINYLATLRFRDFAGFENQDLLWLMLTSANGISLLIALCLLLPGRTLPVKD